MGKESVVGKLCTYQGKVGLIVTVFNKDAWVVFNNTPRFILLKDLGVLDSEIYIQVKTNGTWKGKYHISKKTISSPYVLSLTDKKGTIATSPDRIRIIEVLEKEKRVLYPPSLLTRTIEEEGYTFLPGEWINQEVYRDTGYYKDGEAPLTLAMLSFSGKEPPKHWRWKDSWLDSQVESRIITLDDIFR